jgi:hypothetical protein
MPESSVSLWFNAPQTWVIPVLKAEKGRPVSGMAEAARAAQVSSAESVWTFGAAHPEDVPALMSAQVGDWVVETDDGHRHLFTDREFRARFVPDGAELAILSDETQRRAAEQRILAGYQEGEAYRRGMESADRLSAFALACMELGQRNAWPDSKPDSAQEIPSFISSAKVDGRTNGDSGSSFREKMSRTVEEKMRLAFAGELPLTVWITRTVRQEFPVDVVQRVMREISEHGGENGGKAVFESVGRHRDTALDAILRCGSEYTMGVPIENSLSQKHWESRGIQASPRMVSLARELLAPLEMEAIRQANPGEVLPFNRDGFFNDKIASKRDDLLNRDQGDF